MNPLIKLKLALGPGITLVDSLPLSKPTKFDSKKFIRSALELQKTFNFDAFNNDADSKIS